MQHLHPMQFCHYVEIQFQMRNTIPITIRCVVRGRENTI